MEHPLQSILILVLGWLLGTLSPAIVDAIRSKREAALNREAVENELLELSAILLPACYRTMGAVGKIDRAYLEWQKDKLEKEPEQEKLLKFLGLTKQLLAFPDDQIEAASQAMAMAETKAALLQKYPVPLVDQCLASLKMFEVDFQSKILQIRRNISLLESIVDQSREFYRLTFVELSDANHKIIQDNLKQTYSEYAERAKTIIDQVYALRSAG